MMESITIIDAESRAKAVLLTIQGKPMETQLKIIVGAIRGATEQAAQIAIDKGVGNGHMETCAWIAAKIRLTK